MQHGREGASHQLARDRALTSQMNVNRSCQLASFGSSTFAATYATNPTLATNASEYAEVAVKMGGAVDMVGGCECSNLDVQTSRTRRSTAVRCGEIVARSHARRVPYRDAPVGVCASSLSASITSPLTPRTCWTVELEYVNQGRSCALPSLG